MPADSRTPESITVWQATARVLTHPWRVFILDWNWKAALLSALFRAILYGCAAVPRGPGAMRGVWIELAFRILVGGFWGSLLQAYRGARPAWLAGFFAVLILPGGAHTLEYMALKTGGATHIGAGMFMSILVSVGSLLINWLLMRKGLLVTGEGAGTLAEDLRRLPAALAAIFKACASRRSISQTVGIEKAAESQRSIASC
jgi:hypothetical protein